VFGGQTMLNVLCNDIYQLFLLGNNADNRELFDKVFKLRFSYGDPLTVESLDSLLDLERKLMNSKGQHKQLIEQQIFQVLSSITLYCSPEQNDDQYLTLNEDLIESVTDSNEKRKYIIALKLVNFAIDVFEFKKPRDNFNSKRKSLALLILGDLSNYYDIPEALNLCILSLKSKKKALILAGIEFSENYFIKRNLPLDTETIEILDKIILQTKDRSIAVSALDIQVKLGHISEFEALMRIDEWKEKHYYF
jgi:hypothetical protein